MVEQLDMEYVKKVAAAIRKNGYKQAFGQFYKYDGFGNPYDGTATIESACALGQAAINLGERRDPSKILNALRVGPEITCPSKSTCSKYGYYNESNTLGDIIIHLNDHHKWTLKSIANFVDKVANNA